MPEFKLSLLKNSTLTDLYDSKKEPAQSVYRKDEEDRIKEEDNKQKQKDDFNVDLIDKKGRIMALRNQSMNRKAHKYSKDVEQTLWLNNRLFTSTKSMGIQYFFEEDC